MLLRGKAMLVLCRYRCLALGKRERRAETEGCCHVCPDHRDLMQQGPSCPVLLPAGWPGAMA